MNTAATKKFVYTHTDSNGVTLTCEIEEGGQGKVTFRISDNNSERCEAALRECENIGKMLGIKTQRIGETVGDDGY